MLGTLTSSDTKVQCSSRRNSTWQCHVLKLHNTLVPVQRPTQTEVSRPRAATAMPAEQSSVEPPSSQPFQMGIKTPARQMHSCGRPISMCYCLPPAGSAPQESHQLINSAGCPHQSNCLSAPCFPALALQKAPARPDVARSHSQASFCITSLLRTSTSAVPSPTGWTSQSPQHGFRNDNK